MLSFPNILMLGLIFGTIALLFYGLLYTMLERTVISRFLERFDMWYSKPMDACQKALTEKKPRVGFDFRDKKGDGIKCIKTHIM